MALWPAMSLTFRFFTFRIFHVEDCSYCRHVKRDKLFYPDIVLSMHAVRTTACVHVFLQNTRTQIIMLLSLFCELRPAFNL